MRLDLFAERIGLAESFERLAELAEETPADAACAGRARRRPSDLLRHGGARARNAARLLAPEARVRCGDGRACCSWLLAPLFIVLGLVVAVDVGLPTVFWQQRPGVRGRPFKLYKFRTMRGAHDQSGARIADAERLSAIGRFLRRTRLDELPQLYNILIGDMSFVGPRPLLPVDGASKFPARLLVPPGLTGWAQVKGGREISAHDKAVLDIWYLRHASLWLDIANSCCRRCP